MSKAISRRDFLKVTGAVGAAGLLAACGGNGGAASSTVFRSRGCFRGWPEQRSRYSDHELVGRRVPPQRLPGGPEGFLC